MSPALVMPVTFPITQVGRFLIYALLLGICAMFYVWSRIGSTGIALELDAARAEQERLSVEHERLVLELAARESVVGIHGQAIKLGLVEDVPVREVH